MNHPSQNINPRRARSYLTLAGVLLLSCGLGFGPAQAQEHPSEYHKATDFPGGVAGGGLDRWEEMVPKVEQIEISSSADDSEQDALFYNSGSDKDKPLLLVLHSWSIDYTQNIDIPMAEFAIANDWVFMHPDFRGANVGDPNTTGSDLVMADMKDALDYARENARIDSSRIYVLGYSGGAMNALLLASEHPDVFAGVAAWVPVYDLVDWFDWNDRQGAKYAEEIAGACGGIPTMDEDAKEACRARSPSSHSSALAGEVPVLIGHGIDDTTVPPSQALHAFNDLAEEADRISQAQIDELMSTRKVPEALLERSQPDKADLPGFDAADTDILLYLKSGQVELVLFEGEHDMLYRPGLDWLSRQQR